MYDTRQYISVLSPPSYGTQLGIVLKDFSFNNTFTFAVSGILTTDTELDLSHRIFTQVTTFLNQNSIYFNGVPTYVDLPPVQQYMATRTDHCTCLWGQSVFTISTSGNTTGSIIQCNNQPTLLTVSDIKELGPIKGVDLTDDEGNDLTDNQIATLSKLASAKLIAFTRNPIIISTYLQELCTNGQLGVQLKKTPILDFFPPQVRQPIAFNLFSAIVYTTVKGNYILEPDGYLTYRFDQQLVDYPAPFDPKNDVLLPYISGFPSVPDDIENTILELIPIIQAQIPPGVGSYKGGSFAVDFKGYADSFNALMIGLRPYYLYE